MKIQNLDLEMFDEALERVGKREMSEDGLMAFVKELLTHETTNLKERVEMFDKEEIEEKEINQFDFYSDGYHFGILAHFNNDNLLTLEREKQDNGDSIEVKAKYVDQDGKRVRLVLRSRKGLVTIFTSTVWFMKLNELMETSEHFVLVGGLQTKFKNSRTQEWEKVKQENEEYYEMENYTFNLWQLVHLIKKGKTIDLVSIEKPEENGD